MLLLLSTATAVAGYLDLSATTSVGCGPQWVGDCLTNTSSGANDVLGIHTPGTRPILTVGASSTSPTTIDLGGDDLNGFLGLTLNVSGYARSASTSVEIRTQFKNSSGSVIATHTDVLHSGATGSFSVDHLKTSVPLNAVSWTAALRIRGDAANISAASADCFSGCNPPDDGPGTDDGGCTECSKDCGDWTALGHDCGPANGGCTADCFDEEDDDSFKAGVILSP